MSDDKKALLHYSTRYSVYISILYISQYRKELINKGETSNRKLENIVLHQFVIRCSRCQENNLRKIDTFVTIYATL